MASDENEIDLTKFPPPLPKGEATLFLIGEIFLPGIATMIYSFVHRPEGKRVDLSFFLIGLFQLLLVAVVAGIIWAWAMGISTFYTSLKEGKATKGGEDKSAAHESPAEDAPPKDAPPV